MKKSIVRISRHIGSTDTMGGEERSRKRQAYVTDFKADENSFLMSGSSFGGRPWDRDFRNLSEFIRGL